MPAVWSENSAHSQGVAIGRALPDPWISDAELRRAIQAEFGPRLRPRKSVAQARAERWRSTASVLTFLAVVAGVWVVFLAHPPWLPRGVPEAPPEIVGPVLKAVPLPVQLSLFGVLAVLALGALAMAVHSSARGRASQARMRGRLIDAGVRGALQSLERRRGVAGIPTIAPQHSVRRGTFPPPPAYARAITPQEAEQLAADWMRHLGEASAAVTRFVGDGGIDVQGTFFLAQVKHFAGRVAVAAIREFAGVVAADPRRRNGLFFTATGYGTGAIDFANRTGIALFTYDSAAGTLHPNNPAALYWWQHGLDASPPA